MTIATTTPGRWAQIRHHLRRAVPFVLLGLLTTAVWLIGWWLAPLALFAVACWRAPDPAHIRYAAELLAMALVLVITAVAVLIQCARGRIEP